MLYYQTQHYKIICNIIIGASLVVVEIVDVPVVVVVGLGVVGLGVVGLGVVVVMDSNYTKNEISRFGILHLLIKYRNIIYQYFSK